MSLAVLKGLGITLALDEVEVANRTGSAAAVGDVVQFDLAQSATETTSGAPGLAEGALANFIQPVTLGLHGYFGIVQEAIADNATGRVLVRGYVNASTLADAGGVAIGEGLTAANAADTLTNGVLGTNKIIGIAAATVAASATATIRVYFNGIEGIA